MPLGVYNFHFDVTLLPEGPRLPILFIMSRREGLKIFFFRNFCWSDLQTAARTPTTTLWRNVCAALRWILLSPYIMLWGVLFMYLFSSPPFCVVWVQDCFCQLLEYIFAILKKKCTCKFWILHRIVFSLKSWGNFQRGSHYLVVGICVFEVVRVPRWPTQET